MILNYRLKQCFLILILIILILILLAVTYLQRNDKVIATYDKLDESLKKDLINIFIEATKTLKVNTDNIDCYLRLALDELKFITESYRKNKVDLINKKVFYREFVTYIKNEKLNYLISLCLYKRQPFITNMSNVIRAKYNFGIRNLHINTKDNEPLSKREFSEYIELLGYFLANYKYVETSNKFARKLIKNPNFISKQSEFKKTLISVWKLGSYICTQLNLRKKPEFEIKLFNKYLEVFLKVCSGSEKGFPLGYDWFLFASHYPTILSYKLFIDYKVKNIVTEKYISEILRFIPKINFSRHIKRFKSNAAILSINFIIAHLFKYSLKIELFHDFILSVINSDVYKNDITIQYQEPKDGTFVDGLYFDGGFVIHKNLVSYNYLLAYLYPSLFYKLLFNKETGNVYKIFNALSWLTVPNRNINPVIVSRYGKFNEIQNVIKDFISHSKAMDSRLDYKTCIDNNLQSVTGIKIIESTRVVIANFSSWSIQVKINSELAYGETDIFNRQILKQIAMNKIMFFDNEVKDIPTGFQTHSMYPGVLSYRQYLENTEYFDISHGTKTYVLKNVKYSYIQLDRNTIVIYTVVTNDELNLSYEEINIICEHGIVIGYFNIEKNIIDDLYLTVENSLISRYVKSGILFSDDKTPVEKYTDNEAIVKKIGNHILYYNLISSTIQVNAMTQIEETGINIILKIYNTFNITLDKNYGLHAVLLN